MVSNDSIMYGKDLSGETILINKDELNKHDLNFWRIGDGSDH